MTGGVKLDGGTRRAVLKEAVGRLKSHGLDTPVLDGRLIVQHALGIDWQTLFLKPDQPVSEAERGILEVALARRAAREPVSRIVGRRHFWTLDLAVTPDTLDPRADTESVVEAALAAIPDRATPLRLLDLGAGTGALLLALLTELPSATGVGVDKSLEAALVAAGNAASHNLGDRAQFIVGDWADALDGRFDLIVSNPPYIPGPDLPLLPADVRDFDPHLALDGGADGLDAYRRIFAALPDRLAAHGVVVVEIGSGQGEAVTSIAHANGMEAAARRTDLGGIERALTFKPGARQNGPVTADPVEFR